jgi:hypothetical protein
MFTATVRCVPVDPVKVKGEEGHVVEEPSAMQTVPVIAACAGRTAFGVRNKAASRTSGIDDAILYFFIRTYH